MKHLLFLLEVAIMAALVHFAGIKALLIALAWAIVSYLQGAWNEYVRTNGTEPI